MDNSVFLEENGASSSPSSSPQNHQAFGNGHAPTNATVGGDSPVQDDEVLRSEFLDEDHMPTGSPFRDPPVPLKYFPRGRAIFLMRDR